LAAFIEQTLDPEPEKRPQTAREWIDAMTRFEGAAQT